MAAGNRTHPGTLDASPEALGPLSQSEWLELYHLFRRARTDFVARQAFSSLAAHVLSFNLRVSTYPRLLEYSQTYGEKFILPDAAKDLLGYTALTGKSYMRIVDIGCGYGWLGRGLVAQGKQLLLVDSRKWTPDVSVRNLEKKPGINAFRSDLREGDFITMCDFLHCIEPAAQSTLVNDVLREYPFLAIEFVGRSSADHRSYKEQLKLFGASVLTTRDLLILANPTHSVAHVRGIGAHVFILAVPRRSLWKG